MIYELDLGAGGYEKIKGHLSSVNAHVYYVLLNYPDWIRSYGLHKQRSCTTLDLDVGMITSPVCV